VGLGIVVGVGLRVDVGNVGVVVAVGVDGEPQATRNSKLIVTVAIDKSLFFGILTADRAITICPVYGILSLGTTICYAM
jgi:hypothetical protein